MCSSAKTSKASRSNPSFGASGTVGAALLIAFLQPAFAGEYTFCLLLNKVAAAGKLRDYSDKQVENGLCMTTKEVVSAISTKDSIKEEICMQSSKHMMLEFMKRFPNRDPKSVSGKC